MSTERLLQVHLVVLCLLGAVFVALSSPENGWVPLAVIGSGVLAILFTDAWKWFHLHKVLANLGAIAAVAYSLQGFFGSLHDSQLLAIANLLVYLQLILFFQEKNDRIYWQIILLSLLQVVVGAALNLGVAFGGLLMAYTAVAISALVLFFVHREMNALITPDLSLAGASKGQGAPPRVQHGLPPREFERHMLTSRMVWQSAGMTCGAFLFATVYFFASPRSPGSSWQAYRGARQVQSGFSRELELQRFGKMLQDNSLVMRVWLENAERKKLPRFEPYFQGEAFRFYDSREHVWQVTGANERDIVRSMVSPPPRAPAGSVVQHYRMEPSSQQALFTIAPSYSLRDVTDDRILLDRANGMLYHNVATEVSNAFYFSVGTTGIVNNSQPSIVPYCPPPRNQPDARQHIYEALAECLQNYDPERFAGLAQVAADWLEKRQVKSREPLLIARALEEHFLQPGAYTYTLDMNIPRDESLDPIEDFVMNHRRGHCQYFASALVMMLRSQGIPARMVVGYRGFEYNEVGGFYQVRQRHAHAWVEAYVAQEHIPNYETTGGTITPYGAWVRLDGTPGNNEDEALGNSWLGLARDWLDDLEIKWSDYVVDPNQSRQRSRTLGEWIPWASWWESLPRLSWRTFAAWLGIHFPEGTHGLRFDWRASVSAMALTVLLFALARLASWIGKRWGWQPTFRWRRARRQRPTVPFYARLEKALARLSYPRRAEQTPREYVEHCSLLFDAATQCQLRAMIDAFYRVRFGAASLSTAEQAELEQALNALERREV